MHEESDIAAALRDSGGGLWSSVECDMKRDRVIVYARLAAHERTDLERALAESQRVLTSVLGRRFEGNDRWLAAVQWSERLCKTFTAREAGEHAGG